MTILDELRKLRPRMEEIRQNALLFPTVYVMTDEILEAICKQYVVQVPSNLRQAHGMSLFGIAVRTCPTESECRLLAATLSLAGERPQLFLMESEHEAAPDYEGRDQDAPEMAETSLAAGQAEDEVDCQITNPLLPWMREWERYQILKQTYDGFIMEVDSNEQA